MCVRVCRPVPCVQVCVRPWPPSSRRVRRSVFIRVRLYTCPCERVPDPASPESLFSLPGAPVLRKGPFPGEGRSRHRPLPLSLFLSLHPLPHPLATTTSVYQHPRRPRGLRTPLLFLPLLRPSCANRRFRGRGGGRRDTHTTPGSESGEGSSCPVSVLRHQDRPDMGGVPGGCTGQRGLSGTRTRVSTTPGGTPTRVEVDVKRGDEWTLGPGRRNGVPTPVESVPSGRPHPTTNGSRGRRRGDPGPLGTVGVVSGEVPTGLQFYNTSETGHGPRDGSRGDRGGQRHWGVGPGPKTVRHGPVTVSVPK